MSKKEKLRGFLSYQAIERQQRLSVARAEARRIAKEEVSKRIERAIEKERKPLTTVRPVERLAEKPEERAKEKWSAAELRKERLRRAGKKLKAEFEKIGKKKVSWKRIEALVHGYRRPTRRMKLKYKPMARNILEATEP